MKNLLSKITEWITNLWRQIKLCTPSILYTLFFSLLPIALVVLFTALQEGRWLSCCMENIKNGELFLVSMSFIASSWFIMVEIPCTKALAVQMPKTTILALVVIIVSTTFILEQRLHNNLTQITLIAIVSAITLICACFVYARCISFRVRVTDEHSQREQDLIEKVTAKIKARR